MAFSDGRVEAVVPVSDIAKAREFYEGALRLEPKWPEIRLALASVLLSLGETARAKDQFQQILKDDPVNAAARRQLGLTLLVLEDAKGKVSQDSGGLLANGFVAVRAGRFSHQGRVDDLPHSRPADARVAVLAGDRNQHILLIERKFLDAGDPDQRVVALPLRKTSESIEQRHFSGSPACNADRGAKAAS
jgi:tetratricopeptide (TPR) repeat protein